MTQQTSWNDSVKKKNKWKRGKQNETHPVYLNSFSD